MAEEDIMRFKEMCRAEEVLQKGVEGTEKRKLLEKN